MYHVLLFYSISHSDIARSSKASCLGVVVLLEPSVSMPGASERVDVSAPSLLPIYRTDAAEMVERASTWRRQNEAVDPGGELRYVTFCMPRR